MMKARTLLLLAAGCILQVCSRQAPAATATKQAAGTDLTGSTAGVWSGGGGANGSPNSSDVATWTGTSLGAGLTLGSSASWGSISASGAASDIAISGAGTLTLGASGITLSGVNMSFANPITLGGAQTWNVGSAKTLSVSGNLTGGANNLTKTGAGTLSLSGTASTTGTLYFNTASSTTGYMSVLNGATISAANLYLFQNSVTSGTQIYNQTGGTVTLSGEFGLGSSSAGGDSGCVNTANISGGTLTAITQVYLYKWANSTLSLSGSGTVNAGTFRIGWVDSSPTGTINLGDGTSFSGGTSINDGGTSGFLSVTNWSIQSVRNYVLNLKGGTLRAGAASGSWLPASSFTTAAVQDAGGIIDNGGNAITIAQVFSHGGVAATDGGLLFKGSSTTTLSGANTYTGPSVIRSGTLQLNAATSAGTNVITLGDTLTGSSNVQLNLAVASVANAVNVSANGTGNATLYGNVQYSGHSGTLTVNRDTILEIPTNGTSDWWFNFGAAGISGSGALILKGGGGGTDASAGGNRIQISGSNSHTGGTTVQSGMWQVGAANQTGTGAITLGNANSGSSVSQIRVGVGLTNTIIIAASAPNSAAGIGTYVTTPVFTGPLQINRAVTLLGGSDRMTWSGGAWSGSGNVTVSGGRVTHEGVANTWTGNMTINASSIFQPGHASSLTSANSVTNNGTFQLNNVSLTINGLAGNGTVQNVVGGNTLTVGAGNATSTFDGIIQNSAGTMTLTKTGTGTLKLTSASSSYSGNLTVKSGALSVATANNVSANGPLGNSAAAVTLGDAGGVTGTLDYTGATATSSKPFTMAAGGTGAFQVGSGVNLTLSGLVNGTGDLSKSGTGTLTLSVDNSYGSTTISAGTLQLGAGGATGTAGTGAIVDNGALVYNRSSITVNNAISGSGTVSGTTAGALTVNQNITLTDNNFAFTCAGGSLAAGRTLSVGTGTGTIISTSAGTGQFVFNGGTYSLSASGAGSISVSGAVATGSGGYSGLVLSGTTLNTAGTVNLGGKNTGEWGITFGSGATINASNGTTTLTGDTSNNGAGKSPFLFIGNPTAMTLNASAGAAIVLQCGTSTGTGNYIFYDYYNNSYISLPGAGNVTFSAAQAASSTDVFWANGPTFNLYGGGTLTLNAGPTGMGNSLKINASGSTVTVAGSGSGTMSGAHAVTNTVLTFNIGGTGSVTQSGAVSGSGGILVKTGTGTLTLGTANTYAGGTTNVQGTLALGNATALGTGTLTLLGGALDSSVASLVNNNNNVQNWNGDFAFVGSQSLNLGTGAVTMNASRIVTVSANNLTVGGAIAGAGFSLTKSGAGTLQLNVASTYSGGTTVSAGTLQLNHIGAAGSTGAITLGDGSSGASAITLTANVGGSAFTNAITVSPSGSGTVTINQPSNYSTLSGLITLNRDATISSTAGDRTGVSGKITGSTGTLTFSGGRVTMDHSAANASDFTGNVAISSGTLQMNSLYGIPSTASVTVNGGALFRTIAGANIDGLNGSGTVHNNSGGGSSTTPLTIGNSNGSGSFSGVIQNGSGADILTVVKNGTGTQTLSGVNTYTGNTTINNGTLALSGSGAIGSSPNIILASTGAVFDVSGVTGGYALGSQSLLGVGSVAGAFTASAGSRIYPGTNGVAGTLNFAGNVTFNATTTNYFDLCASTSAGAGTNDLIVVNGNLTNNDSRIYINDLEYLSTGTYCLFQYGGTRSGTNTLVSAYTPRQVRQLDYSTPQQVNLLVSGDPALLLWQAAASTNWDIGSTNWYNLGTLAADQFYDYDGVLFDDSGAVTNAIGLGVTVKPGSVTVGSTSNYTFSGAGKISGRGSLRKAGTGTLTINTANDFTGGVTVSSGTLLINSATSAGSGPIVLGDASTGTTNAQLTLNVDAVANPITVSAQGTGTATLHATAQFKSNTGTITLSRPTTLSIYNSGGGDWWYGFNSIGGNVGTLTVNGAAGGNNRLVFSTANTFTGAVVVSQGRLQLNAANGLGTGANSLTVNSGADVRIYGGNQLIDGLNGAGGVYSDASRTLTLGCSNGNGSSSGVLSQTLAILKTGTGTQTLSGNSSYSFGTTLSQGTLVLNHAAAAGTAGIGIADSGTGTNNLQLTLGIGGIANTITVNTNGSGTVTLYGNAQNVSSSGSITLNRTAIFQIPVNGTSDWWFGFGGNIGGSGGLIVRGGGGGSSAAAAGNRVALAGSSNYSGGTVVESGMLQLNSATGAGTGAITLGSAGTGSAVTQLRFGGDSANNIVVSASAPSSAGGIASYNALQVLSGALQVDRAVTLNGGSDRLTWSGAGAVWSGSGNITISGGRVTHEGVANTWTGALTINASSTFQAGHASTLSAANAVTNNGTLQLMSVAQTIGPLFGSGTVQNILGANALTINCGAVPATFSGIVQNNSGTMTLAKTGAGTQTLSGNSTFTGGTTVSQGVLVLNHASAAGTGAITLGSAGTGAADIDLRLGANLSFANNIAVANQGTGAVQITDLAAGTPHAANTGTLTVNRAVTLKTSATGDHAMQFNGVISGSGTITVDGVAPSVGSGNNRVVFGNSGNTFAGNVVVTAGGQLQNNVSNIFGTQAGCVTSLQLDGYFRGGQGLTVNIAALTGSGQLNGFYGGGNNVVLGCNNASGTFSGTLTAGASIGSLFKVGSGTQTFTGANTIGQGGSTVTISGGALQYGDGGATGDAGTTPIVNNATLIINRSGSATWSQTITGTGSLVKAGAGTVTLSNAGNSYSGITTVNGGTLRITGVLPASTNVVVNGGGTAELVTAGNTTLLDSAEVRIAAGGKMNLAAGVAEQVRTLYLNNVLKWPGTWGASASTANNVDSDHFQGTGILVVTEGSLHPATTILFK